MMTRTYILITFVLTILVLFVFFFLSRSDFSNSEPFVNIPLPTRLPKLQVDKGVIITAAGDIACDKTQDNSECRQKETAQLIESIKPEAVLALGDLQYQNGSYENFISYYDKSWGRFKKITYPIPGNHEYETEGASGFFKYFKKKAGERGYYNFMIGKWHLLALNSNCYAIGGCEAASDQNEWLTSVIKGNRSVCTLAYWHHPVFSSGQHGNNPIMGTTFKLLYDYGVDIILAGHDHVYERFAPINNLGSKDEKYGIRQFIVGTGGRSLYTFKDIHESSEIRLNGEFGVLELTLKSSSYDWRFITVKGVVADSGSGRCH